MNSELRWKVDSIIIIYFDFDKLDLSKMRSVVVEKINTAKSDDWLKLHILEIYQKTMLFSNMLIDYINIGK